MELQDILSITVKSSDIGATPLRRYLFELLKMLIEQTEAFNSKRPWGNSGWVFDVYGALIENNLVPGTLDGDGFVSVIDVDVANNFIVTSILTPLFGE